MNESGNNQMKMENNGSAPNNDRSTHGTEINMPRINLNEQIRRHFSNIPLLEDTDEIGPWIDNLECKIKRMRYSETDGRAILRACMDSEFAEIWDGYEQQPLNIAIEKFRKLGAPKSKREQVYQNIMRINKKKHTSYYGKYHRLRAAMNSRKQFAIDHSYHMDSVNDLFFYDLNEKQREFLRGHGMHEDAPFERLAEILEKYGHTLIELEDKEEHVIHYANGEKREPWRNNSKDNGRHSRRNYPPNRRYQSNEKRFPYQSRSISKERTTYNGNRSQSPFRNANYYPNKVEEQMKENANAITDIRKNANKQEEKLNTMEKIMEKITEQLNTLLNREINDPRRVSFEETLKDIDGPTQKRNNHDIYTIKEQRKTPGSKGIMKITATINNTPMTCIVDTGASTTVMDKETAQTLGLKIEKNLDTSVTLAGGTKVK
ncbi:hypothetical protein SNEBB_007975, partial [Seison nebaliae]